MKYFGIVFFGLIIWIILFFIFRELFCWYYKINEIVSLLKSIDKKLGKNEADNEQPDEDVKIEDGFYKCANCGRINPIGNRRCIDCQTPRA